MAAWDVLNEKAELICEGRTCMQMVRGSCPRWRPRCQCSNEREGAAMSEESRKIRVEWKESDAKRDEGLQEPEDVEQYKNLDYGPDPVWNLLDVYRPEKEKSHELPVIVVVHGGGLVYGDKELYRFYAMSLAQRGFAVVCCNYRLAPEHPFPAQLEDFCGVMRWICDHADEYGMNLDHLCLAGDSAGGHLTGLICAMMTDPSYAAQFPFRLPENFKVAAIGMNCGVYSPFDENGKPRKTTSEERMEDFLPGVCQDAEKQRQIDVLSLVNADFPPAYIMSAVGDYLLEQAGMLEKACRKADAPYVCKIYGSEEKPLYHVFHVDMKNPVGTICNDEECAFFRSVFETR